MWQLASAIGEIALRRRGPESLPASTFLVTGLLVVYVLVSLVYLALHENVTSLSLANLAAQIVLVFGFVFAVLAFFKLERRYQQTMSAMLGVNVVILLTYLPFAFGGLALNLDLAAAPFFWFRIGLALWSIFIEASIFARVLNQPLMLGLMFEMLYVVPSLNISEYFAPQAD